MANDAGSIENTTDGDFFYLAGLKLGGWNAWKLKTGRSHSLQASMLPSRKSHNPIMKFIWLV
jgi:hypothetical protein